MKPAPLAYTRPTRLSDALAGLAADPGAKVLAGGQSLVPLLNMRLAAPTALVDVTALPDLAHVRSDADGVRVGALARHADVLADAAARQTQPLLAMALAHVAHATIRNRGTTVGSLVHADAAAEMPAVLCLLGGSVDVESVEGRRTIRAADLYAGPMESTLAQHEIAVEAFFPALAAGEGVAFDEVARRHGDYAVCGVAARVRIEQGTVASAQAAYVAVADVPTVVDLTPALTDGDPAGDLTEDTRLAAAADLALQHLAPEADLHASAAYRAQLVRVLTARVLRSAIARAAARAAARPGAPAGGAG